MPRIERPRPAHNAAGRTGASDHLGQVRNAHPHLPKMVRRPKSTRRFSWCTSNGWPTPAGHKGRRTGRQPATRGARRASRSLHLAALAAPCSPYSSPRPSPTPRAFPAPAGCSWGPKRLPGPASGRPAGCLPLQRCVLLELCLPALSARALLQRVHLCSGPGQSGSSWGRLVVLGVPRVALGGSRNVFCGEDLNGRPVLSF